MVRLLCDNRLLHHFLPCHFEYLWLFAQLKSKITRTLNRRGISHIVDLTVQPDY